MTEELLAALDPARDYGDRSYTEVVEAVRAGTLTLTEGATVPVIREAGTGLTVKGTGQPAGRGAHAAFSRSYIQEQFANNAATIWTAIMAGIAEGDPRWAKLALEYGIGAPLQDKGQEGAAADFMKVLAALAAKAPAEPATEYITVESRPVD